MGQLGKGYGKRERLREKRRVRGGGNWQGRVNEQGRREWVV